MYSYIGRHGITPTGGPRIAVIVVLNLFEFEPCSVDDGGVLCGNVRITVNMNHTAQLDIILLCGIKPINAEFSVSESVHYRRIADDFIVVIRPIQSHESVVELQKFCFVSDFHRFPPSPLPALGMQVENG